MASGTTAETASAQDSSEAAKGGWLAHVSTSAALIAPAEDPAEDRADADQVDANTDEEFAEDTTDPATDQSGRETRQVGWSSRAQLGASPVDPTEYRPDALDDGAAGLAEGQGGSKAGNGGGWLTQVQRAAALVDPADGQADAQDADAAAENETADTTSEPAAGESGGEASNGGWSTEVQRAAAAVDPADGQADAQEADAAAQKEAADQAEGESGREAIEVGSLTQAPPRTSWVDNAQYLGATDKEAADSTAEPKPTQLAGASFQPDPQYKASSYDTEGQVDIYGAKTAVAPPRPLLELGREQYTSGSYGPSSTLLGEKNPLLPGLSIYGDWRTAIAYNNFNNKDIAQVATRLNLDVDFKITATERVHAFFTPIQSNGKFTRYEFGGGDANGKFNDEFDGQPQTLFFEGDVGSIYTGFSGSEAGFDLPFTVGLFPLFLQNGIWANDAILGGAISIPAKNSPFLDLANFDVTFFAAFDNVDNAALGVDNHSANLYGVTTFLDAFGGYIEAGYGLVQGVDQLDGVLTHFVTASYSGRYYNTLSNSTRLFGNFGDGEDNDGFAIISENSLISGLPSTLLPYANFFFGYGAPQPLVDGNGAGILKNVGINFETDALTGFPKLDDTGSNTFGGAIGVEYLFDLNQQIVFELAMVQPFEDDGIGVKDPQYGIGVRYQIPLTLAWLFRADATYQIQEGDNEDNFGIRAELRRKF